MKLEICANSFESAFNAEDAGAHRIELCQQLSVGGITPSFGLLKQVIENLQTPVFVLIRPRSGDFVYTDAEFEIIKKDIQASKKIGCKGIVSGVLNDNRTIDIKRTKKLVDLSKPLPFTFHRAFDEVTNPIHALEQLIELGVNRVLTSGQQSTAESGIELLKTLKESAKGRITVLPGSGINSKNVKLFKAAGFKEIHASASIKIQQDQGRFTSFRTVSDVNKIKAILDEI